MVFLGDFIYADVPWLAGVNTEQYNKRYRQTFASPEMKKMVEKIRRSIVFEVNLTLAHLSVDLSCSDDRYL